MKFINPSRKSEFQVRKWRVCKIFKTITSLTSNLKKSFEEIGGEKELSLGYVEPGHGYKGRQQWIHSDDDLHDMYQTYKKKKEILLWCYLPREKDCAKRGRTQDGDDHSKSKRTRCAESNEAKMKDVSEIITSLRSKHGNLFTPEQFHAWAQMIQIGKHESREEPPNYPFFKGRKRKDTSHTDRSTSPSSSPKPQPSQCTAVTGISPGKRIHLRTELIEQLGKLGTLLEKGNITQEQYGTLKSVVLEDITRV